MATRKGGGGTAAYQRRRRTAASKFARRFANQLHGRFGLHVELVDERGSSMEAQELLGNNEEDDAVAAAVILQRYLDSLK